MYNLIRNTLSAIWCAVVLLVAIPAFAQKELPVGVSQAPFAEILGEGRTVEARQFTFPENIYQFHADSLTSTIHVQMRSIKSGGSYKNRGYVAQYKPGLSTVLWADQINYLTESVFYADDVLLHARGTKLARLVPLNGSKYWKVPYSVWYTRSDYDLVLGYPTNVMGKDAALLAGFGLRDGEVRWKRSVDPTFGWNGIEEINDSTLLISAAGLHTIDLHTGRGWDYPLETGYKDYGAAVAGTALGLLAGALTGTYFVSYGANIVHGVGSPALSDSTGYYVSDRNRVVHLAPDGTEVWSTDLPKKLSSHMELFRFDDRLAVVNLGYAFLNGQEKSLGNAYLAVFDIRTGEQEYLNFLSGLQEQPVNDVSQLSGDRMRLIFDNRTVDVAIDNHGETIGSNMVDVNLHGKLRYTIGNNVYVRQDSLFVPLQQTDTTAIFVMTDKGHILHLTSDKRLAHVYSEQDYLTRIARYRDHSFIEHDDAMWFIDAAGRPRVQFEETRNLQISDGKFYTSHGNLLWMLDLDELGWD